jgi:hypothetical protein
MINIVTTVFDKNGNVLGGGSFYSNAFWSGMGGLCETTNSGDPIVLYDETADRWLVSQFAFTGTNPGDQWRQCVAISQTSDPLGSYNRYEFDFTQIGFPDYPKHGIVSNAITVMANLFNPGFSGTYIGAMDKVCMYAGNPSCVMVGSNLGSSEFGFVAADLDDPTGTATVPALFATAMSANANFDVWRINPNFVNTNSTTISRIARLPIAAFDSDLCIASRERCVPHPGSGDNLETLSGRLMHRLQVRDFGTHLSMVASHTVDADGTNPGRAGIRWYELRSTNGGANWSVYQQGTHAPADNFHRWMPSIAMNAAGDIGVGYMVSNASTPVAIRVSGQTAANSGSGSFDADEATCRAGVAGADWTGRAGDYSATNVDPDRDTFWHTNEFGRATNLRGWGTAVCEFSLQSGPVNNTPVVAITAPANGSSFTSGEPVSFSGTAVDTEDGNMAANIGWTSSIDGSIGSGASFSTSSLSNGTHSVVASVTDSGGKTGSDQISVTINPPAGATMHVENISIGTVDAGGRRVRGSATVTIRDNNNNPVSGVTVVGDFSGTFNESGKSGVTNGSGQVSFTTNGRTRSTPTVNFCVSGVTGGGLTYAPGDNAETFYACGAPPPTPTSIHVASVSTGTSGRGRNSSGTASVTIVDNLGNAFAGASVSGNFSGTFNEPAGPSTTNSSGVASFTTSGSGRNPVVNFCVSSVVPNSSLVYNPADDAPGTTCGNFAARKNTLAASLKLEEEAYTFELGQNFPNPFRGSTTIGYSLAERGQASIRVYNLLGQEVATLANGEHTEGRHFVTMDTSDLSSGIYIYVLEAGSFSETRNMTIMN